MTKLLFLDTETTGIEVHDRLLQVAYSLHGENEMHMYYFKPPVEISIEAMSVHHVTPKMLENAPAFKGSRVMEELQALIDDGAIVVAHNAQFDVGMLAREGLFVENFICTKNMAENLLDLPMYRMQYLRYYFGVELAGDIMAHSAEGDVAVLKAVFDNLFELAKKSHQSEGMKGGDMLNVLYELSKEPLLRRFRFGKYKGQTFEEVAKSDFGYLQWLWRSEHQKPEHERNSQLINTLKYHMTCQKELF